MTERDFLAGFYTGFFVGAVCGGVIGIAIWELAKYFNGS